MLRNRRSVWVGLWLVCWVGAAATPAQAGLEFDPFAPAREQAAKPQPDDEPASRKDPVDEHRLEEDAAEQDTAVQNRSPTVDPALTAPTPASISAAMTGALAAAGGLAGLTLGFVAVGSTLIPLSMWYAAASATGTEDLFLPVFGVVSLLFFATIPLVMGAAPAAGAAIAAGAVSDDWVDIAFTAAAASLGLLGGVVLGGGLGLALGAGSLGGISYLAYSPWYGKSINGIYEVLTVFAVFMGGFLGLHTGLFLGAGAGVTLASGATAFFLRDGKGAGDTEASSAGKASAVLNKEAEPGLLLE